MSSIDLFHNNNYYLDKWIRIKRRITSLNANIINANVQEKNSFG